MTYFTHPNACLVFASTDMFFSYGSSQETVNATEWKKNFV